MLIINLFYIIKPHVKPVSRSKPMDFYTSPCAGILCLPQNASLELFNIAHVEHLLSFSRPHSAQEFVELTVQYSKPISNLGVEHQN